MRVTRTTAINSKTGEDISPNDPRAAAGRCIAVVFLAVELQKQIAAMRKTGQVTDALTHAQVGMLTLLESTPDLALDMQTLCKMLGVKIYAVPESEAVSDLN